MKTNLKKGMWKSIAFLTVVLSCLVCVGCEEPLLRPEIVSYNITLDEPFILSINIIPNEETEVTFRFREDGDSEFQSKMYPEKISGSLITTVIFELTEFQDKTLYYYEIIVSSKAGLVSEIGRVVTGIWKSQIKLLDPEELKMNSAKLVAWVTPYFIDTKVVFEYSEDRISWKKHTLPNLISGKDSVKLTFNLSGLKANTEYGFRVKTTNSVGITESEIKTFITCAVSDYDGNHYRVVTINGQVWLKENFKGTHYVNGDKIEGHCWYNHDEALGEIYGGLYTWHVANDPRGLIIGFEVPERNDWEKLFLYIADTYWNGYYTYNIARSLMSKNYWVGRLNGEDKVGFSALPAGNFYNGEFFYIGNSVSFWSKEDSDHMGFCTDIMNTPTYFARCDILFQKTAKQSIRLIKKEGT